jgi:hypothetical protein
MQAERVYHSTAVSAISYQLLAAVRACVRDLLLLCILLLLMYACSAPEQ